MAATLMCGGRTIDLSGKWNVSLGSDTAVHAISLPGTTDQAGLGIKSDLQPELTKPQLLRLTRKHRHVGPAYYKRRIDIPADMAGKPLELVLERVMWRSRVSIDGHDAGTLQESLTTPHSFRIADGLSEGEHELSLYIDNSKFYDISGGELAHAYTDDTQIKWNGVLGRMQLRSVEPIEPTEVQVTGDIDSWKADVAVRVDNHSGRATTKTLKWSVTAPDGTVTTGKEKVRLSAGVNDITFETPLNGARELWSEFNPKLYNLSVSIDGADYDVTFGMREIESAGHQIRINGKPVFLRGTLDCCVFPLTGTPPTNEESWARLMSISKEWGLNHLRFHSWCPPEAAFAAADKLGIYLQVELPLWSTGIDTDHSGAMKQFIRGEYDNIVRAYGNHPSFCMMTVGNELQSDFDWLNEMVSYMKGKDGRRLYAASSFTFEGGHGGHAEPHDDFMVSQWTDDGWVRGQGVFNVEPPSFNRDYTSSMGCVTVPLVTHEIGQYAVYPDISEIEKYTGVLDPLNLKAIRNDLKKKGRIDRAHDYVNASGSLAAVLYKEEFERALKTPGISGIQLLGLYDFPGQGTAHVGLLNSFGESKGIVEPEWFRQFSSPVVPLARYEKAVYTAAEPFSADIEIANYREAYGKGLEVDWSMSYASGQEIASGTWNIDSLPMGNVPVGSIKVDLAGVKEPSKLIVEVSTDGIGASNSWPVWVYPAGGDIDTGGLTVTRSVDEALATLESGGMVLLSPETDSIRGMESKFVPVFWSPVHFPSQAGGMGVICEASHPALSGFPNDGHSDWQWWTIAKNARVMDLDSIPGATPIVGVVDNFTSNRDLALVTEATCGKGKLLISGVDLLSDNVKSDPARAALLRSLAAYMKGSDFTPRGRINPSDLKRIVSGKK